MFRVQQHPRLGYECTRLCTTTDCIHPDTNMLWETARPSFRMLQSILRSYISVNTDERYSFLDVTSIKVHKYGFFSLPLSLPRIHFLNVGRLQENISLYLFAIQELLLLLSIDET